MSPESSPDEGSGTSSFVFDAMAAQERELIAISMAKNGAIHVLDESTSGMHLTDVDKHLAAYVRAEV